ncbi:NACHT domain-containing protein [Nocardiopsis ganjiahuensis]|uniref:NACHT domain-containing protein n=1 Tax=Nocardiopsis ganjiahuensis TaxID=239984 RepID=UPI00034819A3|nr:NACHT domain-containing protein [Nocardiopsis ganjiahuensis]
MYEAALKLGVAVVKAACGIWIGNPIAENAATTVVDLVQEKVTGRRDQRRLERKFAEIEESIAERVLGYLDHEFHGLAENEREAAVLAVADTFERAGLTDRILFEQDLDPLYLERYVRGKAPGATRDLGGAGVALYDRVLPESCAYVMATLGTLPRFQAGAFTELLRRESLVLGKLDELLDRIPKEVGRKEDTEAAFETAYRRKAAERWDVLELFGTEANTRNYPLTLAYLSLRVSWDQRWREQLGLGDGSESLPSGDLRVEQALAEHDRTFLRGPAGTGKTTLLRWVGVRASRGDFPEAMSSWNGLVPFMVPLRQYVGEKLPEPVDFVRHTGRHLADQAPQGWVTSVLAAGRGIVLVDGVDELPQSQREAARRWLRELMADFPGCRYVVTTRPGAAKESWLEAEGFVSAELQPLTDRDVRSFIHHWHEAVRSEVADETERELLTAYERELTGKVMGQRHLRTIASTPLLCALLCALYRDRHTSLPRDRMEVYEAALAMLLKDRDQQRGIEGVELSRKELVLLLQELARWLVINGSSDAPTSTAQRQVARVLAGMHRVEEEPEEVFTHLIVRSGLLQCPTVDRVSFLHRTFEEYLAAKAIVEEDSFPLLVGKAHDDQWHEVVVMAAGHATPAQREELVTGLLDRADQVKKHHDRLLLVAFACLETSPQLAQRLREEVEERVRSILPPRTKDHVHALGLVGESALPLLVKTPPKNAREAAKTIEAASLIGGPNSVPVIGQALRFRSWRVRSAALRAWWNDMGEDLATVLLPWAEHYQDIEYLPIPADRIDFLTSHLPKTRSASIEGWNGDSIQGIGKLPQLTRVKLNPRARSSWHDIDLAPLRDLPHLRELRVYNGASVSSLKPLVRSRLSILSLGNSRTLPEPEDLRELEHLEELELTRSLPRVPFHTLIPAGLRSLAFMRSSLSDLNILAKLPNRLRTVRVIDTPHLKRLDGLESQIECLAALITRSGPGLPLLSFELLGEFENLTELRIDLRTALYNARFIPHIPRLRLLHLESLEQSMPVPVPRWIRTIPTLDTLNVQTLSAVDLTDIAGARNLVVRVFPGTRVLGAELLGDGSRVERRIPGGPW